MVHNTAGKGQKSVTKYKKANVGADTGTNRDKILDPERLEGSVSGKPLEEEKFKDPLQLNEMIFRDKNNEIKIVMNRKKNRAVKLEIYFNGIEIRPATFTGSLSAMNYWKLLQSLVK